MKHPRKTIILLLSAGYLLLTSGFCLTAFFRHNQSAETIRPYTHMYLLTSEAEEIQDAVLDINTASVSEFAALPGISRSLARQVISYREQYGSFQDISELLDAGMPEALFRQLAAYFYICETQPKTTTRQKKHPEKKAEKETTQNKATEKMTDNTTINTESVTITEPSESTEITDTLVYPDMPENVEPEMIFPLELNAASAEEFCALPGVGPVIASAIVEYRETIGGFVNCRQLLDISGIGEIRFSEILPYVYLETEYPLPEQEIPEEPAQMETDPTETPVEDMPELYSVNLNTATREDLLQLPGCNEMLAEEILVLRDRDIHVFYNIMEITLAEHITTELFAAWMPYLTVDDDGSTQIPYVPPLQQTQEKQEE